MYPTNPTDTLTSADMISFCGILPGGAHGTENDHERVVTLAMSNKIYFTIIRIPFGKDDIRALQAWLSFSTMTMTTFDIEYVLSLIWQ